MSFVLESTQRENKMSPSKMRITWKILQLENFHISLGFIIKIHFYVKTYSVKMGISFSIVPFMWEFVPFIPINAGIEVYFHFIHRCCTERFIFLPMLFFHWTTNIHCWWCAVHVYSNLLGFLQESAIIE